MIRLPQPTTIQNYLTWARQLISSLEIQQTQNEQKTSSSSKEAELTAEAKAWFNG